MSNIGSMVRRYQLLIGLGAGSELIYLIYFIGQYPLLSHYQHDTDMGIITGHSHGGFALFVGAVSVLFLAFALALWAERRLPVEGDAPPAVRPAARPADRRPTRRPVGSFRHRELQRSGHPVEGAESPGAPDSSSQDAGPVPAMAAAAQPSGGLTLRLILGFGAVFAVTTMFVYPITATDLFSYIAQSQVLVHYHQNPLFTAPGHYPHDPLMILSAGYEPYPSPYGPLGVIIDAIPALLAGTALLANLLLLKAIFASMILGCAYLAYRIVELIDRRLATGAALFIAWNPFILIEAGINGHNDIAMMLLTLLAIFAMARNRLVLGPALLVAAAMVKYASIFLLPLFLVYGARRQKSRDEQMVYVASSLAWSFAVFAVLYAPFWGGTATIHNLLIQNQRHVNSFSSVVANALSGAVTTNQADLLGWALFALVYLYVLRRSAADLPSFLWGCFVAMFAFVALAASNVQGWYLLWPVTLAALVPRRPERVCAFLAGLGTELSTVVFGYIFVWLGLKVSTEAPLNAVTYGLTFLPAAAALFALSSDRTAGPREARSQPASTAPPA